MKYEYEFNYETFQLTIIQNEDSMAFIFTKFVKESSIENVS